MSDPFERPAIAQAPLSIVLPTTSRDADVDKLLGNWVAYLETLDRPYEILLVKEGDSDTAPELAAAWAARSPRLRNLQNPGPPGIGAALRIGLAAAQLPLLCYCEGSHAYQPADLGQMLAVIDKVDLVSGYRVRRSSKQLRALGPYAYRSLLRFLFGLRLMDVDCPFKLFRRSIFTRIPIQSDGPFVHVEILAKANFLGCIMSEVPVHYQPGTIHRAEPSARNAWWADACRVFFHPDFGPARLPEQPAPTPTG